MGFFDKGHEKESPIGNLRAHIGTFMYFVKVGKSKFKHKGRVGEIFADMDNTQYLFQQATSGTMYDMKKKLDYTLWDAATHKYTEDIQQLKDELLKAVDEGEESGVFEEEKKEKEIEEKKKEEKEIQQRIELRKSQQLHCPNCQSTNIKRISATSRVIGSMMLGILSSNIGKTYQCNKCKYKW